MGIADSPGKGIWLAIDVVLRALIGPRDGSIEKMIAEASHSGNYFVILRGVLHAAVCSIEPGDRVDFVRFAELLRHTRLKENDFNAEGLLRMPTADDVAKWRTVALAPAERMMLKFPNQPTGCEPK